MKFHPYSEIFPLLGAADQAALVEDIKANGLREEIWLYQGALLDGRNRFLACQKAEVEPKFREFSGSDSHALAFVRSANIVRRHLNESQRALAASRLKEHLSSLNLDAGAVEHPSANLHSGDLTTLAAEQMNVSRRSVFHADKVRHNGSKRLEDAVASGEVSVSLAATVVNLPPAEQLAAATKQAEPAAQVEPAATPEELEEDWKPDPSWAEQEEAAHQEYLAAMAKVMDSDDKLAAAHGVIKQQATEIAALKISRDGFMHGKSVAVKMLKHEQRKVARLEAALKKRGYA